MTNQTTPDAATLLEHLGKPVERLDAATLLHADDQDFSLPSHSPIGGLFFKRHGLSITFCPPDFYHMNDKLATLPAILTNVQIYAGEDYYAHARYPGALPFGLAFEDGHAGVVAKLGQPGWTFPLVAPVKLARFDLIDRWLLVVYGSGATPISMIQIGLKPKRPLATVLPKILQPDIHALQSMFTHPWTEVAEHAAFDGIDLAELVDPHDGQDCSHEIDVLPTHGLEMYFRKGRDRAEPVSVLSAARYMRKGMYDSIGFDGELPFGIRFEDTPDQFLTRVDGWPVTGKADALSGYYIWRLPEYLLQVQFSVMEQRINRVYVASHGYYSEALLESPLLERPNG